VLIDRCISEQHFLDAVELGGCVRNRLAIMTGDKDVNVSAERLGGGQRFVGRVLERFVIVLGEK
jgi:hypothetical protein